MQELKDFLIDFLIILSAATPKQIKTMKKNYMKPALRVVRIQQKCQILSGSIRSVESGDTGIGYGGGGNGPARAPRRSGIDWDDWDE